MLRRSFLAGVSALSLFMPQELTARFHSGGIPAPGGGSSLVKTVTIENTSGVATAVNSHTPTVGLLFKKGDVPTGTWPILKTAGGTVVPYTYWNRTSWSDGSIKFLGCLPRFPNAISGSSTATMEVWNGGSAQSASTRTLAEVYAANITVVGTGGIDNISGTWTCDLQAANIIETVSYGDGPAGRIWRFLVDFKQSGAAHGQLVTYFYLMSLQDAAGNLAGFRVLPRVTQPWYNQTTVGVTSKNYRSFTSLTLQYGAGPTVFDPMANSYSAKTFTWANSGQGNNLINCTANDFNSGMAVRLTTTGTLPTGLSTGTTYWIYPQAGNNTLYFIDGSAAGNINNGVNVIAVTGAGSGTHTVTPIPYVDHFCTYWCATTSANYVYVQGGGSVAADATLRIKADKTYDHTTRVLPPYDMSIGTVTSNASYNWSPYTVGPLALFIGTTGERDDIGILSAFQARQFYTQAAVDERLVRLIGLAQGHLPGCTRDVTTKGIINLSNGSYSGMPATGATTMEYRPSNSAVAGFTGPAGPAGYPGAWWTQCFSSPDTTHQTQFSAYPYIVTGEPQFLDLTLEAATIANLIWPPVDRNFTISATTHYGIGPAGKDTYRAGTWAYRDILWAAVLAPDTNPDGSASTTYLKDLAAAQSTYLVAWNAQNSSWWNTNGFWGPQGNTNGRASWQIGYLGDDVCLQAAALEDANALIMATHLSKWPPHVNSFTGSLFMLTSYYEASSKTAGVGGGSPWIDSDVEWGARPVNVGDFSWASAGNLFTWTTPNFTPTNGDKVIFWNATAPSGFSLKTPYYAINVSGNNFQLSASPGGSVIAVGNTSSMSAQDLWLVTASAPTTGSIGGYITDSSSPANQWGMIRWMIALGITTTGLSACDTAMGVIQSGVSYTANPKYARQVTY